MRYCWMVWWITLCGCPAAAQENELLQQYEDQAVMENDSREQEEDIHQWQHLLRHPVNLNIAGAEEFAVFTFLSPVQVQRLLAYRQMLGPLNNILELQAVPGWSAAQIRKIAPYVTVAVRDDWKRTMGSGIAAGKHQLLTRMGIRNMPAQEFLGSSPSLLVRYQFRSKYLQFAVNTEKDMGEQLFQQGRGISYLSFHLLLNGHKNPRNMIIFGDYLVNLGQGLVHWQGRAVKKTGQPIMIKRQAAILQPYRSNDENRFHRGIAIAFHKQRWSAAVFFSRKRIDANVKYDSLKKTTYISSLLTSGYHRTSSELYDKHALGLSSAGGSIAYRRGGFRSGINAIHHFFSLPYLREPEPYRLFLFRGRHMFNYSIDYHYTLRNVHLFGEAAVDNGWNGSMVQGFMYSLDPGVDLSLLFRKISRSYNCFQGNAFTEATEPNGEEGIYAGLSLKLSPVFTIDTYADYYRFPWLKYAVNIPGYGRDFLAQATWKPDKKTVLFARIRWEKKSGNLDGDPAMPGTNLNIPNSAIVNDMTDITKQPGQINRNSIRIQINRIFSRQWEWRARIETSRVSDNNLSTGFLMFSDLFWTPGKHLPAFSSRFMFYETSDYSSRLYAYENDVMFYSVIPSFSGTGILSYLNMQYTVGRHIQFFIKGSVNGQKQSLKPAWAARFQLICSW